MEMSDISVLTERIDNLIEILNELKNEFKDHTKDYSDKQSANTSQIIQLKESLIRVHDRIDRQERFAYFLGGTAASFAIALITTAIKVFWA